MILPTRRWFVGAALAALLIPVSIWWPPALGALVLFDGLWIVALVLDAVLVPTIGSVTVERDSPAAFSVGRSLPVTYRWRQSGARPLTVVAREEIPDPLSTTDVPARQIRIPVGGVVQEVIEYTPRHRGKSTAGDFAVRLGGPLGLVWRQGRVAYPWTVVAYPHLGDVGRRGIPTQAARRREAGQRNLRRLGEGRTFEALREWVPGDDTRSIDWKATARRGKMIARQYEDERRQHVLLVIDAGRLLTVDIGGTPRLELVITAALKLAYAAIEHDDNVGLMVFARNVQTFVPPARGRRALRAILDGLAAASGELVESDYPAAFRYLAARNRRRALTVVFTDIIDRTASEALVTNIGSLRHRHLPLAVTLRDPVLETLATARPDHPQAAFERAAAEELLLARDEALASVRSRGVIVLDVPPHRASEAVVDQYHHLKRRGVL